MATNATKTPARLGLMALPFAAVGGFLATGAVIMHDLRSNDAQRAPIDDQITAVEFMSEDGNAPLTEALASACAATGCDAHPTEVFIRAGLSAMTEADLADALRLQAVTLADLSLQIEAASDLADRADLEAQFMAEAEITALYRGALRQRRSIN